MKRSPLRRVTPLRRGKASLLNGSPPRRRTPLRGKPSKRARADEPLAERCEVGALNCTGRAQHRHHILPRSAGGTDDKSNTCDCCGNCHGFIHAHPAWAYEAGWLRRRGT